MVSAHASWSAGGAAAAVRRARGQQKVGVLAGQQQEHRKHRPLHVALVTHALQRLPGARLHAAPAAGLQRVAHEFGRLGLAQPGGSAGGLELIAGGHRHGESEGRAWRLGHRIAIKLGAIWSWWTSAEAHFYPKLRANIRVWCWCVTGQTGGVRLWGMAGGRS